MEEKLNKICKLYKDFDMYLKAMILGVIFVLATRLIIYLFDIILIIF